MPERIHQPVKKVALRQGYEPNGISAHGLMLCFYFTLLFAVALHVGMWVLMNYLVTLPHEGGAPLSAIPAAQTFKEPRLQPSVGHDRLPWQDLNEMHKQSDATFNDMGWTVDSTTGVPAITASIVSQLSHGADHTPTSAVNQQPAAETQIKVPSPTPGDGHSTPLIGTTEPAAPIGGK